jgi:membrane protein DedA with SNARE-associated domain/rhodanese-related sulfurtransferase
MLDPSDHTFRITYLALWSVIFAGQAGLPIPATIFLLAAGALSRAGGLSPLNVLGVSLGGCLAADLIWFEAGRRWGHQIVRILCSLSRDPHYTEKRVHEVFRRWGLRSLLLSKFVPGFGGVIAPLAATEGYGRTVFLAYDALGSLLWSTTFAGLGFLFADSLAAIASSLARFGEVLTLVIGLPLACYVLWRIWVMGLMLRHLRTRRITPVNLHRRMLGGEKFAVIDLLDFEDNPGRQVGIAGAFRMDPARLRKRIEVIVPEGLGVVLYCSSSCELASARVAVVMKKRGVSNVWVLEGGMNAWEKEGLPVTQQLSTRREVVARLGIKIIGDDAEDSEPTPVAGRS